MSKAHWLDNWIPPEKRERVIKELWDLREVATSYHNSSLRLQRDTKTAKYIDHRARGVALDTFYNAINEGFNPDSASTKAFLAATGILDRWNRTRKPSQTPRNPDDIQRMLDDLVKQFDNL